MGLPDNILPEDKLPQCWSDDVRMNALFAPFRLKTANPESWEMKMKFWSDMLRQWCKHRADPTLSASDAKFAFQRKGRTPACIDIVIEEMFRNGELSPLSKYQQILHNGPEGWVKWGARLAFKPAVFALTAVSSFLPARQMMDNDGLPKASIDSTQRLVLECEVKDQATDLLNNFPLGAERVGTIEELMKACQWTQNRETFEILLGYLVSQGAAVKKDDVIKLAEPNKKVSPVTETDEAFVKLLAAESRLQSDAERLTREAELAAADARAALQLGNRRAAKNHLRRKHKALQRATTCEDTLENVKQLMQQMREVDVNSAIAKTYKTGAQAMKRTMEVGGLDVDAVHDTMDDLKEVMDNYAEVEKALSTTVDDFDALELEAELQALLSTPGAPSGGTPGKEDRKAPKLPSPPVQPRKESERDFVFDGEERMMAELNELSFEDPKTKNSAEKGKKKLAVALAEEDWTPPVIEKAATKAKPSKPWYPASSDAWREESWNNNLDTSLESLSDGFGELRTDERLHPGQPLNLDFTKPPKLYNTEFQVHDHKPSRGVWLYNRDANSNVDNTLTASTEYFSSESPGKSGGSFQMAPGGERLAPGERRHPAKWSPAMPDDNGRTKCSTGAINSTTSPVLSETEDLERRLRNLRGFNL